MNEYELSDLSREKKEKNERMESGRKGAFRMTKS